jgi:hypothetical protein
MLRIKPPVSESAARSPGNPRAKHAFLLFARKIVV